MCKSAERRRDGCAKSHRSYILSVGIAVCRQDSGSTSNPMHPSTSLFIPNIILWVMLIVRDYTEKSTLKSLQKCRDGGLLV